MRMPVFRPTVLFLLGIALAACGGAGGAAKPTAIIQSPAEGSQFREGEDISVRSTLADPTGVVSAELFVDGANASTDTVASQPGTPSVTIVQRWKAVAGIHVIGVRAFNRAGIVSELATVTVSVVASTAIAAPTAATAASAATAATANPVATAPAVNTVSAAPAVTSTAQPSVTLSTPANSTVTAASALSPLQRAIKATAYIESPLDDPPGWVSSGSGSVVDAGGLILTNFHVVRDIETGALKNSRDLTYVGFATAPNREPSVFFQVKAVALDQDLDLAVIKIIATKEGGTLPPDLGLTVLPLGNSDAVQVGERIQIIGYPGLGGSTLTVTEGIVSGFLDNGAWIKTDTEINPGNSGGLAINAAGELVGVPSRHIFDPKLVGKYGMVRPINPAKALIDKARWLSSVSQFEPAPQVGPQPTSQPPGAPPGVPPGMYATGLQVVPAQPMDGAFPTFKVTFLNNLGITAYYNWFVKLYEPDKKNSFGETAKLNSTFPPGITTIDSMTNWKAPGAQPCRPFFARVFYQAPDGTIVEFPKPGGDSVAQYFTVCQ